MNRMDRMGWGNARNSGLEPRVNPIHRAPFRGHPVHPVNPVKEGLHNKSVVHPGSNTNWLSGPHSA